MFEKANKIWWRDHEENGDYENPEKWSEEVEAAIPVGATRSDWVNKIWVDKKGKRHCPICSGKVQMRPYGFECMDGYCPSHKLKTAAT